MLELPEGRGLNDVVLSGGWGGFLEEGVSFGAGLDFIEAALARNQTELASD